MNNGEIYGCQVIPLVDPDTGEELKLTKDGTFQNLKTKRVFGVTESGFVVELVDPVTHGKAHLEGDTLVSDETKKKYKIDNTGTVIVDKVLPVSRQVPSKELVNEVQQQFVNVQKKKTLTIGEQYLDYVNKVISLLDKEHGVIIEFAMDSTDKICSAKAISTIGVTKRLVYAQQFNNTKPFQNNVLFTLVKEFTKRYKKVSINIIENVNNYNCLLRNDDNDSISFVNITDGCAKQLKYEVAKTRDDFNEAEFKKRTPVLIDEHDPVEKNQIKENAQFYFIIVITGLLIIFCVVGIILLFG